MAQFKVETTSEEQAAVLEALKEIGEATVPVRVIAEKVGMGQSRVRYVLIDLMDAGKIERIASKAFNKHYVRYAYKIIEG
jgi:predicted transcriptional regulator